MIYEGFQILEDLPHTLCRDIADKHITTEFKPNQAHESLYGVTAEFQVVGYANDGQNEGYAVKLLRINAETETAEALRRLYDAIPVPHITLSLGDGAKAVNTRYLNFTEIAGRVVTGVFKGF